MDVTIICIKISFRSSVQFCPIDRVRIICLANPALRLFFSRVPKELWRDRMLKMRAAGLNGIQFVIQWNLHEPKPGTYNFEDNLDIESFMKLAQLPSSPLLSF